MLKSSMSFLLIRNSSRSAAPETLRPQHRPEGDQDRRNAEHQLRPFGKQDGKLADDDGRPPPPTPAAIAIPTPAH